METRVQEIVARGDSAIKMGIIPGHFATNHSHVNYYLDMTSVKSHHKMARAAAAQLAHAYVSTTLIDTIICLEGTEIIGAFLADYLTQTGVRVMNHDQDLHVLAPEMNTNNQMIFRDNTQKMVWGKHILLLLSTVSTGKTINRFVECLQYYNGLLVGVASLFSAVRDLGDIPVNAIFTQEDIPSYRSMLSIDCDLCRDKRKLDALVNSYGYSKL